jgi:phospholipid/cholesterol/gamma-HCH transport system substrate-binding protein
MIGTKNKKAVVVGIFSIIGVLIFMAAVLTLGGQRKVFVKTITIRAYFDEISGLQEGNNIWYEGVNIGTVQKISLSANAKVEITLHIEKAAADYIHKDVQAKIGSDGLIGNRIVVLSGGDLVAPVLRDGDIIKTEKFHSTDELLATLQKNNLNLLEITSNFKTVSKRLANAEGTLGKLVSNDSLLRKFQSVASIVQLASENTRRLTSHLENYSAKLQTKGSLANDLVTDTIVFASIRSTLEQLQAVAGRLGAVTSDIKTASQSLNDTSYPIGNLLHGRETNEDVKLTLKSLKSASEKLDKDLEALQHNFLLRGFFRKQKK